MDTATEPARPDPSGQAARLFGEQRASLWGLAYRMTGSAEDAEDAVQEAFARLIASPPEAPEAELGRWLARVTVNLSIDLLRRRRRRAYAGPWLPAPIATPEGEPADPRDGPEVRYGLAESATFAFLLALEALSPRQRAALLLRDVLGHSARETAERLGTSEGAVRVLHLRARRALDGYDRARCVPTPALRDRHREVLGRLLACLAAQDVRGLEALLAESVETVTDAAGEYTALATPMVGRARVARFYLRAALHRREAGVATAIRLVNGLPAALITLARPVRRQAPRSLLRFELDGEGRIARVYAVLARAKLAALAPA